MAYTPTTAAGYYTVPDNLIGVTPRQISEGGAKYTAGGITYGEGADELAQFLGVGIDQPFAKGQQFTLVGGQGGKADWATNAFTKTSPYQASEDALAASKPITEQAYSERERQLQGEKQPLMDRYQNLIDTLKGKENKETTAQGKYLSQEYGKRGIPISSGMYQQDLTGKTQDISQFYAGQEKDVTFEREDKLRELSNLLANLPIEKAKELNLIDQKIAEMKAQGATQQMTMALEMYKQQREDKWKEQEQNLKKQEVQLQYGSSDPSAGSLYDLFQSRVDANSAKSTTKKSLTDIFNSS